MRVSALQQLSRAAGIAPAPASVEQHAAKPEPDGWIDAFGQSLVTRGRVGLVARQTEQTQLARLRQQCFGFRNTARACAL